MDRRVEQVRSFVEEVPVCDEDDVWDARVEREAAMESLREISDGLAQLREDLYAWFIHIGNGRIVELDDDAMEAVRTLEKCVRFYRRGASGLVSCAVKHLARQPNRGGILAYAEQAREVALDAKLSACPRTPPRDRTGWPWTEPNGQPITEQSQWDLWQEPKPKIPKAVQRFLAPSPEVVSARREEDIKAIGGMLRGYEPGFAKALRNSLPEALKKIDRQIAR